MFFPWYTLTLLAFESSSVVKLRLAKIGLGGSQAFEEVRLMFAEKASAAMESASAMMMGGTPAGMVDRYRVHVAANQTRLDVAA